MMYGGTTEAKTGGTVPLFLDGKPMHSKYNPAAEAATFAAALTPEADGELPGCVVVAGIGGGFHLQKLLADGRLVIACEDDEASLSFCRSLPSVRELERNSRCILGTAETLGEAVFAHYLPHVHGGIAFLAHRAWEDRAIVTCSAMRSALSAAISKVGADYSVQAHFAKLWQRNIFLNLKEYTGNPPVAGMFDTKKTAAVVAAGPSLDRTVREIQEHRSGYCVIATDTALSVLNAKGIGCDAVVSIDAQNVSAEHFVPLRAPAFRGKPPVCFFDAAAPRKSIALAKKAGCPVVLVHNGHPLVALCAEKAGLWRIDAGSGTVAIAACDIACKLGFPAIRLFGADFAYSGGKAYAQGTYLDRLYNISSGRLFTAEESFCALMFRTELLDAPENRLCTGKLENARTTAVLRGYGEALSVWARAHGYESDGALLRRKGGCEAQQESCGTDFDWREFAAEWRRNAGSQIDAGNDGLTPWVCAMLPYTAFLRKRTSGKISFFSLVKLAYSHSLRYTE